MADVRNNMASPGSVFKEAVCIDAGRVFDSCCDRDCFQDLRCYFTTDGQSIIEQAINIRAKKAEVFNVCVDVEPVTFNRGYYTCNLRFYFLVDFDVTVSSCKKPYCVTGFCSYEKKVILFGSEGNVRIFSNVNSGENRNDKHTCPTSNMPRCVVQTVDPIVLSAKICELRSCDSCCLVPNQISEALGGSVHTCTDLGTPTVFVTLGLFSIVQLIRNVQMLVPVYDFCIPEKQCVDSTDSPCDVFSKIDFPTSDFFPSNSGFEQGCGCGQNDCCDDND